MSAISTGFEIRMLCFLWPARMRRSAVLGYAVLWVLSWETYAGSAVSAQEALTSQAAPLSRFQRTARSLQGLSPELRNAFAFIALTNLNAAYARETQLARAEAGTNNAVLRGWSIAVERYAQQVPILLEDIAMGLPADLVAGPEQLFAVSVTGRTVILGHPRPDQQIAFEQEILAEFCSRFDCKDIIAVPADTPMVSAAQLRVRPDWTFTRQFWTCSHKGVRIQFEQQGKLSDARLLCQRFMQEVVMLADEIAWQQRQAVFVEWATIRIEATPYRPEHIVKLNQAGDALLLAVPLLYANPDLRAKVLRWMQSSDAQRDQLSLELNADSLGWSSGSP